MTLRNLVHSSFTVKHLRANRHTGAEECWVLHKFILSTQLTKLVFHVYSQQNKKKIDQETIVLREIQLPKDP